MNVVAKLQEEATMNTHNQDRIRDRAYALWEADGRPDGRDGEHWTRAERELSEEAGLDLSEEDSEVKRPPLVAGLPIH
jgi:hypothetical protein